VYLPDDLWLHFNPASKRARWWIVFQTAPSHTCGTAMTWVAQSTRWFCVRCNQFG
jgi:hypothetical protein